MPVNRRKFLNVVAGGIATGALLSIPFAQGAKRPRIRAIAFDAFPVFDPRPVFGLAEKLFPGKGAELSRIWRTRQFEYTWLRTVSGHYENFWKVTEDGLVFAAKMMNLDLSADKRDRLIQAYLELRAWPDALPALKSLKAEGIRLAFLSNMTPKMLHSAIDNSGLEDYFEHVISTDKVKTYKPDPRAYQLGIEAFRLKREEIAFAAFAGWDAAGAKWFGYPTFWVNRLNLPAEELGVAADAIGPTLTELVTFVEKSR